MKNESLILKVSNSKSSSKAIGDRGVNMNWGYEIL